MTRFISITGTSLLCSLSMLCASTASADLDFGDFVRTLDRFNGNHHGNGNHRGNGNHYGNDHYDDDFHGSQHYNDNHYDDHYYHQGQHQQSGHQHYGGHQHFNSRPVVVDQGMPYPGLVFGDFGGMGHIHELSMNVRYLANHITFDMYYNYQFNPGFSEIYSKCYAFRNLSYAIHDMEHTGEHVEMTAAINEMDSLFHSLEHDIAGWRRMPRLQVGQGDIRYKMELLEDMMHHLMHDAGVRSQFLIDADATPPATGTGVIRTQPVVPVQ